MLKRKKLSTLDWSESPYGRKFLSVEATHTEDALKRIVGPCVLQVGDLLDTQQLQALDLPQWLIVNNYCPNSTSARTQFNTEGSSIIADAAFLPFDADCMSSVILPHVLEGHKLPHQVLREAYRVLRPEGHLLLTGFNPFSLLGLQRYISNQAAYKGSYYTVKRVRDWLQLLGFEVRASAMYQYSPLLKGERSSAALNFLNSIGNRWLPMLGGGYMISARKREIGMNLVGRVRFSKKTTSGGKLATIPSRKSYRQTNDNNQHSQ